MTKFGYAVIAAIALPLVILGFMSSAQAYPDVRSSLTVDKHVVFGGQSFTATATSNVDCAWNLDWDDQVRQGQGRSFVSTFVAPQVTTTTKIDLVGVCSYESTDRESSTAASGVQKSARHKVTVTVVPSASAAVAPTTFSADLPNSGGPNRIVLLGGVLLALSGAGAVVLARRRAEETDRSAPTR